MNHVYVMGVTTPKFWNSDPPKVGVRTHLQCARGPTRITGAYKQKRNRRFHNVQGDPHALQGTINRNGIEDIDISLWANTGFVLKNPFTIHKSLQYGTEKQHGGMQLFYTSGKGSTHLVKGHSLYCSQCTLSKKTGRKFVLISHRKFFRLNCCSVLGNAVSDW